MKSKSTSKPSSKGAATRTSLPNVDSNSSVSVRKIENGFLVSESGYIGKGKSQQWYNKDTYSPTNPLKTTTAAPRMSFTGRNKK
jgi:hypothetical protein